MDGESVHGSGFQPVGHRAFWFEKVVSAFFFGDHLFSAEKIQD